MLSVTRREPETEENGVHRRSAGDWHADLHVLLGRDCAVPSSRQHPDIAPKRITLGLHDWPLRVLV